MRKLFYIICLLCVLPYQAIQGQNKKDSISDGITSPEIFGGDTVLVNTLPDVYIVPPPKFKSRGDEQKYWRLVYNLKKVYPYAKIAKKELDALNAHLLTLKTEREKKAFTKQIEKELLAQYGDQLKDLTITQGKLLVKLVYRETNQTSYGIVKEFRGDFSAIFWQTLARLFGSNLKTTYDATGADKSIEYILQSIDAGYL